MGRANPPGEPEIQIHPGYVISKNALWAQRAFAKPEVSWRTLRSLREKRFGWDVRRSVSPELCPLGAALINCQAYCKTNPDAAEVVPPMAENKPWRCLLEDRVPPRPFWTEFCMGFWKTLGFSHGCDGLETDRARA